ncbi:hypothetical protein G5I_07638 [Acromyrmex echinatior]|uniref:Uncharacterized protein n=1 Tax=Acromyrmex echinatior TaxID=103372 RepID=F4WPG1_ACREC|nr:hypothetical protein G5I_07638 [Acromyrmex echinatior]
MVQIHRSPHSGIALITFGEFVSMMALCVAWEGPGKLRAAMEEGKLGRYGEREAARNRRERLVVGRSVEARSRESPSTKSGIEGLSR